MFQFEYTTVGTKILLSTVKDALNNILETHQYDSNGWATTSEKDGGVEKYTIDYTNANLVTDPFTIVTDALGRQTKYTFDKSKGRKRSYKKPRATAIAEAAAKHLHPNMTPT